MIKLSILMFINFLMTCDNPYADTTGYAKGKLIYENPFGDKQQVKDWIMEGPGELKFAGGWMEMYSPEQKWDHVFWCPKDFPGSFIAEWDVQNLDTANGLTIIFFAAKGSNGEDIFSPSMPKRDGTFKYYNKGQMNCYHISYYANNPKAPDRGNTHLRKDPAFDLLQTGEEGIPTSSAGIHHVRLVKAAARIVMFIDERKVIDYTDDGKIYGPLYTAGKIGFRQMRWTDFRYRNFKVWEINNANL